MQIVEASEDILAFERRTRDQRLLCVFNLGVTAHTWQPAGLRPLACDRTTGCGRGLEAARTLRIGRRKDGLSHAANPRRARTDDHCHGRLRRERRDDRLARSRAQCHGEPQWRRTPRNTPSSALASPSSRASRLGFLLTDAPKLERNFALPSPARAASMKPGSSPGASGATCATTSTSCACVSPRRPPSPRSLDVVFRVYDDGLGFRYEFPDQARCTGRHHRGADGVRGRRSGDRVVDPAGEWNRYEYLLQQARRSPS